MNNHTHSSLDEKRALLRQLLRKEAAREKTSHSLSRGQQALWFLYQDAPESAAYNIGAVVRILSPVNVSALRAAFQTLLARHSSLRSTFLQQDDQPTQIIHGYRDVCFEAFDAAQDTEAELHRRVTEVYQRPFDLERGPVLRISLFTRAPEDHVLLITIHHIVSDGWSLWQLLSELFTLYPLPEAKQAKALTPLHWQYQDFVRWQAYFLEGPEGERLWQYWLEQLSGELPVLNLPTDRPRPPVQSNNGASIFFTLPETLTRQLKSRAKNSGATLYVVLLAAFQVLLHRYTGQDDILIGSPTAGRGRPEFENIFGDFINPIVLRAKLEGDPAFADFLERTRQSVQAGLAHQDYPFPLLVERLQPHRDASRSPIFQVMFVWQKPQKEEELFVLFAGTSDENHTLNKGGLTLAPFPVAQQEGQFDLTLDILETRHSLSGIFKYNTDLFDAATIKRMAGHFQRLLEGIAVAPDTRISRLPILTEAERQRILVEWNGAAAPYPQNECVHELFEDQAAKSPDAIAVIFEAEEVSYFDLNARANRLAHRLQRLGVGPEVLVGLFVERSVDMVVGLLAILKAGGAYVPLDPAYPMERLAFMAEDADLKVLLCHGATRKRVPECAVHILDVDAESAAIARENSENPAPPAGPDNLAYVIYTSGSTGQPKGVCVEHGNVTRLFRATKEVYHFDANDVWTLFHSHAFDFSVWEIWGALFYGGTLVVVPYMTTRTPELFYKLLMEKGVTVLNQTPSAFYQLIQHEQTLSLDTAISLALRWVIFGGEALTPARLKPWFARHGDREPTLVNMYGITETTVHVTRYALKSDDGEQVLGNIGVPISDLSAYVLDKWGEPVPIGIPGELYVGGAGVARGYLDRPDLTAERFISDPFSDDPQARLYRTGDLCRWLPDSNSAAHSNMEYLGRVDTQVKIRGFRIECGEVENALLAYPGIREAVVDARGEETDKRLVAWMVVEGGDDHAVLQDALWTHLHQRLPGWMVPARFVFVEAMPLTPSGKVERAKLPEPDVDESSMGDGYVAPRTAAEKALAGIFESVLGHGNVGIHDNFFRLGGDSILSIRVVAKAREAGYAFSIKDLFVSQTVARLARETGERAVPTGVEPISTPFALISETDRARLPADVEDAYPLAALQAGMLFHSQYEMESAVYHDVFSYYLQAPYDESALQSAVQALGGRHPILRTSFHFKGFDEPLQHVHYQIQIPFAVSDIRHLSSNEQEAGIDAWIAAEKHHPFDWESASLLRIDIHRRQESAFNLTLSFHHAIIDGWSIASLMAELLHDYLHRVDGQAAEISPPGLQYRDFIALEREAIANEATQLFWGRQLEEAAFAQMPQLPELHRTKSTNNRYDVAVPVALSGALRRLAEYLGVPIKTVLLAAHLRVIGLFSGQTDVVTGLVTNGRPESEDGEKVIGLFLNTLPFRLPLQQGDTWAQLIRATFGKEQEVLAHRRYPLNEMQKAHQGQPLFETAFNFVHFHVYQKILGTGRVEVLSSKFFEQTNFVLTSNFRLELSTGDVQVALNYNPDELGLNQIESMALCYLQVFAMMTENPEAPFGDACLLPLAEIERLHTWDKTAVPYPQNECVHELFEEQAAKTLDAVAIVFGDEEVSYFDLNAHANRLAHRLRKLSVGPEVLVGLFVERSVEMIVGVLAILKAGGAYVPLDPAYPAERLAFMVQDADLKVLLCHGATRERVPECAAHILDVDAESAAITGESLNNPERLTGPSSLAYVIYTSGSTGEPKGVMIEHGNLYHSTFARQTYYGSTGLERFLLLSPVSFDSSVAGIFGTLTQGATLVLPEKRFDVSALVKLVTKYRVTHLLCTPTLYSAMLSQPDRAGLSNLKAVTIAGESSSRNLLGEHYAVLSNTKLFNEYGPTEATVWCSAYLFEDLQDRPGYIGMPIANTRIHILDPNLQPVPIGVPSELHVGGAGIARGYLNRPDLTAERFIPDPFSDDPQARLYRTGDLCRWLPDGNIEFLGRIDTQVKIRGFRIECGEVENTLLSHPDVREAVVDARGEGAEKQLVAWLVAADAGAQRAAPLRDALRASLPDWMIPARFVFVDALPLTPSGKLDQRALPAPEASDSPGAEYSAPGSPTEELLAGLWAGVLKRGTVGRFDNFFDLGGHSLLATQLISRIRDRFDVELPVRVIFEHARLSELAAVIDSADGSVSSLTLPPIEPQPVDAPRLLSFAQQRLWFLDRFETGGTATYNMSGALRLSGPVDIHALRASLQWMVERHESLRMTFPDREGAARVEILPVSYFKFPIHDLRHLSPADRDLQQLIDEHAVRPFELARGPLFRAEVLQLEEEGETVHVLLIGMHHIVSDGWSIEVFVREWREAYVSFTEGGPPGLAPLPIQYTDYAAWQRQWLQGETLAGQLAWWKDNLAGIPDRLELPTDYPRLARQSYRGSQYSQILPAEVTVAIKDFSRTQGVTLFMTLLAAFDVLLSRYSGQDDICVGSPIANRTHTHTENLIGFFVNTLVLRTRLDPDQSFRALLQKVRQTCLGAYAHQDIPFETLVEQINPTRSLSHSPLFQVMLVLQNTAPMEMEWPGLTLTILEQDYPVAKFDLTLNIEERDGQLYCLWEYATSLFTENTIRRMGEHFEVLLRGIVADPERPVSQLPLLTEAERRRILVEWNDTQTPYPQDKCVYELFEAQAVKTPDAVAVIFEEEEVNYSELNARANRLAHRLRALGVGPEVLVGLFVERSVEMVVCLLAILKAGGAYVPLDPEYPAERLAFMAEDADFKVLLCHEATRDRLPECAARILEVDTECVAIAEESSDNLEQLTEGNNLAYVMYTSGSTGKPKGVCVEHRNIVRLVRNTNYVEIDERQVFLQAAPISFDAATFELWGSLLNGARLVVPLPGYLSLEDLGGYLREHDVTVIFLTTALFNLMVQERPDDIAKLGFLLCGGEVGSPEHMKKAARLLAPGKLVHCYGPTENTTFTACHSIPPDVDATRSIPIGIPISNTRVYILDANMNPVPVGISGELYAGGAGVARGYLNWPELTFDKFIPDPFSDDPIGDGTGTRLYRTGDLCRWLPDGTIEFLGRIDTQVKIRGFRIECGEVENALLSHPDIREAVVDARGEGAEKQLVAWLVAADAGAQRAAPLRDALRTSLPDWMIPARFVFVDALLLTPSGKLDRRALPAPEAADSPSAEYIAPGSPTEELLAGLWAGVLKRETVGRFDNFFDLGGHSLLATQLISRIRDSFDVELPVRVVFEYARLSELAEAIESGTGLSHELPPIEPQPVDAPGSLSFAQQRLWFLDRFETEGTATYNMPAAMRLEGTLDIDALQLSLQWMVERHESLRMAFPERDGEAEVVVLPAADFKFPVHDLCNPGHSAPAGQQLQQRIDEHAVAPFDLARGPLFRAEILQLEEEDGQAMHVLLINMHHIISDGWSIGVFVREWREAYVAFAGGYRPTLSPLPVQYGDYAHWQRQWLQGEILEQQSDYWREVLEGIPELLALPTDYPRPAQQSYRGAHRLQVLPSAVTVAIKEFARAQGVTLFMTLLAAFDVLLSRYSSQDDICVGSPIANRTHTHTENLIGFFVNTLVLRTRLNPNQGFRAVLQQVRQTCLEAYAHQDIPFETLVEQLNPTRSLSHSPLFQVMLALQNNAPVEIKWPGLTITTLKQAYPIAKFDLTLNVAEQNGQLHCTWEYATSLFAEETIARMCEHFEVLLRGIVEDPEQQVSQLPLLTEAERRRILLEWNDTKVPYPKDKCVHELFEEQVAKSPDAVAVIFEEEEVSYFDLNARANRLAHRLRKLGVGPEVLVGLFVERSVEMVVGLLAILKGGGAYVPLDPDYPIERLAFMAQDADFKVLLCHGATRTQVPKCAVQILDMDAEVAAIAGESSDNPARLARSNNLAYLIYTSGSTGKPKGVMLEHGGLCHLATAQDRIFHMAPSSRVLQFASISFDAATWEILMAFQAGAILCMAKKAALLPGDTLQNTLIQQAITHVTLPPSALLVFSGAEEIPALLVLITAGEPCPIALAREWAKKVRYFNAYGPTEITVCATILEFTDEAETLPIGRPIANTQVYILDPNLHPVPIGVPGELYVGGAGVARGYLNRPALTFDKFIPDPFSEKLGDNGDARLYRTGDLCRWLPEGNIEFLGRIDTQMKIRGFRIECGEVENALLSHPDVREAVVDARGEGAEKQLVTWLVGADVGAQRAVPLRDELRAHLRAGLPDWMVPARFVFLDAMPLTSSGKIDRRALPAPDGDGLAPRNEYTAPRNPTEEMLCGIFAEILGMPRIGIHDDFFEFGGHSLLAIRLLSSIRKDLQVEIPLRALFQHPTPKGLATAIRAREEWKPSILLPLKSGGQSGDPLAPLFCIHPVGGGAFCYRELADSLDTDRPVYGIQAVGFEGETESLTNIEAMAARYVAEITTLWPKGPYNLYGWSLGGVVAFEMAQQLRSVDREVGLLVLADTVCPRQTEKQDEPEDGEILLHLLAEAGEVEPAFFHEIENAAPADRQTLLRQRLVSGSNSVDPGDVDRFVGIFRANLQALSAYRPSPWEEKIVFLSARERIGGEEKPFESDWRRFARQIAHHTVPGNHFTMHRQPNVHEIAKILEPLYCEITGAGGSFSTESCRKV